MSKTSYYPQEYKCDCGKIQKHYTWSNELETKTHTCECGRELNIDHLHYEERPQVFSVKMSKEQIRSERKGRSTEHFKKNVIPTLDKKSDEGQHFRNKYNIKE